MAVILSNPTRFVFLEEISTMKNDVEKIKDFVNALSLPYDVMYGTQTTGRPQCHLAIGTNKDLRVESDNGVLRRGTTQLYDSVFVQNIDQVNHDKHIYLADRQLMNKFDDVMYKNAYLHLLLDFWKTGECIFDVPACASEMFAEAISIHDGVMTHFEDACLVTKDKNDFVTKEDLLSLQFMYPYTKSQAQLSKLLDCIKNSGCEYKKDSRKKTLRGKDTRGAIFGLKFHDHIEEKLKRTSIYNHSTYDTNFEQAAK